MIIKNEENKRWNLIFLNYEITFFEEFLLIIIYILIGFFRL